MSRVARFAWLTLLYNIAVILWGAYVRASGSGAGCGSHWPLCNGEVVPRGASVQTLVEFSHRLTSGLALILVVVLAAWVWRALPRGHIARGAAAVSVALMLLEAAVGAGLVLFQLVADNASMARALFMSVHLFNTFLLLAALTFTACWTSDGASARVAMPLARGTVVIALGIGLLLVGVSGAVAALGDTLFPARSLSEALAADLSATSHLLLRLRVLHPALALLVTATLAATVWRLPLQSNDRRSHAAARLTVGLAGVQLATGFLNVLLLAPVWMQLVHLLLADLLWIAFVIVAAGTLARAAVSTRTAPVATPATAR